MHQGDLPLNLTWLKDGGPVLGGSGAAAVTPFNAYSTILTVNNVSRSDTGDYTCVAANPVHSAAYTAHLNVNGTPTSSLRRRKRGWTTDAAIGGTGVGGPGQGSGARCGSSRPGAFAFSQL